MKHIDALAASETGLIYRVCVENEYVVYEHKTRLYFRVFTLQDDTQISKISSRSQLARIDWEPVSNQHFANSIAQWHEHHDKEPDNCYMRWEDALMASPVGRAYRTTKTGELMCRTSQKRTWITTDDQMYIKPSKHPYKAYDDWYPVPIGHILTTFNITNSDSFQTLKKTVKIKELRDDVKLPDAPKYRHFALYMSIGDHDEILGSIGHAVDYPHFMTYVLQTIGGMKNLKQFTIKEIDEESFKTLFIQLREEAGRSLAAFFLS